jgi:dihydropyrimidinase/allantoinase
LDFLLEATLHHLGLSYEYDFGILGKVNPPIRSRKDSDYLWKAISEGYIKTVGNDNATTAKEIKKGDLWHAMPGFGGFSLMFPVLIPTGYLNRGVPLQRIAEISS